MLYSMWTLAMLQVHIQLGRFDLRLFYPMTLKISHPLGLIPKLIFATTSRVQNPSDASVDRVDKICPQRTFLFFPLILRWMRKNSSPH